MRELFRRISKISILLSFVLLVPFLGSASAINLDCDTTEITSHYSLMFEGVTYDSSAGTSKWEYSLYWDGTPPALSYFYIELCSLITNDNLVAVEPSFGSIGKNGNLNLWGMKWDNIENFPADSLIGFSFTLDLLLKFDNTQFAPKAGIDGNVASICGPSIFCDETEDPCINNLPPIADCPSDTNVFLCEIQEVCLTGFGATDPDNNLVSIEIFGGVLSGDTVCFTPVEGTNTITLIATDSCGVADTCATIVTVSLGQPPFITANAPEEINLCLPETICINFAVGDPDNDIDSVWTNFGQIENYRVCFEADTSGFYQLVLTVVDSCGFSAVDSFEIFISINQPPVIVAADTTDNYFCEGANQVCVKLTINNPIGGLTGSSNLGVFNASDSTVCFYVDSSGRYCDDVIITNSCGLSDTISYCIDVIVNQPPLAVCPPNDTINSCDPAQICLPGFTATDLDGNIAGVTVIGGTLSGDTVCFDPILGDNVITLIVTDSCGLADTCTTIITIVNNGVPPIVVFDSLPDISLCQPESLCVTFSIDDPDSNVDSIWSDFTYYENSSEICFYADTSGRYDINVFVRDLCGFIASDTISVYVELNSAPVVNLPDSIYSNFCLVQTVCIPVEIIDENIAAVSSNYALINDSICFSPDTAGTYLVWVEVTDSCGLTAADTTVVTVDIEGTPPVVFFDSVSEFYLCQPETLCLSFGVTDPDNDIDSIWSDFTYTGNAPLICFSADTTGRYVINVFVRDRCGFIASDTISVYVEINNPPSVNLPDSISIDFCFEQAICIPVEIVDENIVNIISNYTILNDTICFNPDTTGTYLVWVEVTDSCGLIAADTTVVTVLVSPPPVLELGDDFAAVICGPGTFCIKADTIKYYDSVFVNYGTFDPATNLFCVTIDSSISDYLIVEITDSCGRVARDSLWFDILVNPPLLVKQAMLDTTIYLCGPAYVCLPLEIGYGNISLPDSNISVNRGQYANGHVCFVPYDSGNYTIIATATDSCGNIVADTAVVRILTDQFVDLACPPDTSIFICQPETLCFPLGNIPEWADIEVSGIATWYDAENNQVCFYAECGVRNRIIVKAITPCDTISCEFTVDVQCNVTPLVFLPGDTSIALCMADTVAVPVGIIDPNGNISSIVLPDWVSYDEFAGLLYFMADTSGLYEIIVTVTDSCDASKSDRILVSITIDEAPVCQFPSDTSFFLCGPAEISLRVGAHDNNDRNPICSLLSGPGIIFKDSWIYQADSDAVLDVVIECRDKCDNVCIDSFRVTIEFNEAPVCDVPSDTVFNLCDVTEICLPILGTDVDGNLLGCEIVSGPGSLGGASGKNAIASQVSSNTTSLLWCYTPTNDTTFEVVIRCSDSCGAFCEDSFTVTINLNEAPLAELPADTGIFLCSPDSVSISIVISDAEDNITSIELPVWTNYDELSGLLTFYADSSGVYEIYVRATDSCNLISEDTILITVLIDEPPVCQLPADTSIFICEATEISLPIGALDNDQLQPACSVLSGPGIIIGGNWVYQADSDAVFDVVIECRDACGNSCVDSFGVTIDLNEAPVCDLPSDTTFDLCDITEVCLPLFGIDADGNMLGCEIISGPGNLVGADSKNSIFSQASANTTSLLWCYTPTKDTTFEVVIRCSDSCGAFCEDSFIVTINLNQAPEVFCPADSSMLLCDLSEIFLTGFTATDINGENLTLSVDLGLLSGDTLFFTPVVGENLITFIATDSCGLSDTCQTLIIVDTNFAPVCNLVSDTTITSCVTEQICLPVGGTDIDGNLISCEIVSGPGVIENGFWCYTPQANDTIDVTFRCTDECGKFCESSFRVIIDAGVAPVIADQFYSFTYCAESFNRELNIFATNDAADPTIFELLSGAGFIDSLSGLITYLPDTSGLYSFEVAVSNSCGSDTATVSDTIVFNGAPAVIVFDTTINLCSTEEICFDVLAFDADGDSLQITLTQGPGQFTQLTANSGQHCFTPDNIDSATYLFVYQVSDLCENGVNRQSNSTETISITVITNEKPTITCSDVSLTLYSCGDSVCFTVSATDPDNDLLIFEVLSGNAVANDSIICLTGDSSGTYEVTISCIDSCLNSDTCTVIVNVILNAPPAIELGADFSVAGCTEQEICLGFLASDPDNNLEMVLSNTGLVIGQDSLCFIADSSGVYQIIVTAVDSCGAEDLDTINVTVTLNTPPIVSLGADTTRQICAGDSVCLSVTIDDDNISSITSNYQLIDNVVCFSADTAGVYEVWVAVIDSCGIEVADTAYVTVTIPLPPVLELGEDFSIILCDTGTFCFIAETIENYDSVYSNYGVFDTLSKLFCGTIDSSIADYFIVEIFDLCGRSARDSIWFDIKVNSAPFVDLPMLDTNVYFCESDSICLPLLFSDNEQVITDGSVQVNYGRYSNGQVCFVPDSSGTYLIVASATDPCGAVVADTAEVIVTLNSSPLVIVDSIGPLKLCPGEKVCLFVTIEDDNISSTSSNFELLNDSVCFSADTAGVYEVWVSAIDSCGAQAADTVYITVTIPPAPFVELGEDFAAVICEPIQICIDPDTIANFNSITVNYGQFDPITNLFCVNIDSSISDYLIVEITDSCGRVARDSLWFDIKLNTAPVVEVAMPDTTVYLCGPAYICLSLLFSDFEEQFADGDISVNYGNYANGEICFVPYDSGTYTIIASVTDSCGEIAADTAVVTVLTDQFVDLRCPSDTSIFICQPETLCFPLGDIPVWADISVSGIATWYDSENNQVCFYAECGVRNRIIVKAITPCDTIICEFTVNVDCNQTPVVLLPGDTSFVLCGSDYVSFPVGIGDPDNNIETINIDSWAAYEPISSRISFAADTEGVYILNISATDSCGAQASAQIAVTVQLNEAPVITFGQSDSVYVICVFGEICLPLNIFDRENSIVSVVPSIGYFDAANQQICFTPTDTVGLYCIDVIATDSCGLADTTTKCLSIESDRAIGLDCPSDTLITSLCFPGVVSRFIDISGQPDSIITSFGYFDESEIFFMADTSGFYTIDLSVYSPCSTLNCQLYFDVTIVDSVDIICPADDFVTICGPDTLCYPIIKSNSVQSLSVNAPAFIDGDFVCLPVSNSGTYNLTIIGVGECGADTCEFDITVEVNSAPVLVSAADTTYDDCIISEICIPFTVTDADNNIDSIVGPDGLLTGNEYCFTPPVPGLYNLVFTAYDSCGAIGSDTTAIRITISLANITCPSGTQFRTFCSGDSATVSVLISPFDAIVTVFLDDQPNGYYDFSLGLVVVFPEVSGTHDVMVVAEAKCKTDTCLFVLDATVQEPPIVICPAQIDTNICLNDGNTICFPVSVSGTGVELSVSDNAVLTDSTVCVSVSQDGTIQVITYAQGVCGIDSCITTINVDVDEPPLLTLPQAVVVERCDFDTGQICIPGIFATDDSLLNITKICGPGTLQLAALDSGQICFEPDESIYGTYTFCIQVDDGCNQVVDSFTVEIVPGPDCNKCVVLVIDPGECIPVGRTHDVYINIETNRAIGGFDLLVSYDATVTSFSNATKEGTEIDSWEFFTYRLNSASCGSACPSGTIRLTGIADINNGAAHPPVEALSPNGRFIKITFQVSNNQNIGGLFLPINFIWFDCGDNIFSDPSGNELFIDNKIYNGEGILIWDEEDSISYPESSRPQSMGTPDSCINPEAMTVPRRCIEFFNGGICILDQTSFSDRGDINLNSVPYEVADAVVFTNYFIYGLSAFSLNVPGQIAATDVNADGITLSVADLVLLIRVILGDADPVPKPNPHDQELLLQLVRSKDGVILSSNSSNGIGGAYLVFKLSSSETSIVPELAEDAEHMDLRYHIAGDELRILVFSMQGNTIESGDRQLIKLPVVSGQQPELIKSEFADGDGRPYKSSSSEIELPADFELYQNYPNPFNPSTNISFYLPEQSDWKISIYNVTGGLVRRISGSDETGMVEVLWDGASRSGNQVASGVYFYRLEAGDFKRTRKMMMLK